MKCFLHIGTEKTATKTIQSFFYENRKELLSNGVSYAQTVGRKNHRLLPLAAYDLSRRDDSTMRLRISSDKQLKVHQEDILEKLNCEMMVGRRENQTVVFSSEHIQSRLTKLSELRRLKEILLEVGITDIKVIVYLRRPSDIASSLFSTVLKNGRQISEPPPPNHPYWNNICNHRATLERYGMVFGEDSVIPRLFEVDSFHQGSIIKDILSVMSIPINSSYKFPSNKNERLSVRSIRILSVFNERMPQYFFGRPNPFRPLLVRFLIRFFKDEKYKMSDALYEQYEQEFEHSNEWVRARYFSDKKNLFTK